MPAPDHAAGQRDGITIRTTRTDPDTVLLTRGRLATLPPARRPRDAAASPHTVDDIPAELLQEVFAAVRAAKLPAKRKKSGRPAPAYQIKVSLQGAKPPIWRRLLVPATSS